MLPDITARSSTGPPYIRSGESLPHALRTLLSTVSWRSCTWSRGSDDHTITSLARPRGSPAIVVPLVPASSRRPHRDMVYQSCTAPPVPTWPTLPSSPQTHVPDAWCRVVMALCNVWLPATFVTAAALMTCFHRAGRAAISELYSREVQKGGAWGCIVWWCAKASV